jgi:hypothetical protein
MPRLTESEVQEYLESDKKEIQNLTEQWSGLLDGLSSSRTSLCARLLDNEVRNINEDTVSGNIAAFTRTALPTIRKAWGEQIILPEIVNVQAIPQPTGLVFYLRQKLTQNRLRAGVNSAIELGRPKGLAAPQFNLWNADQYYDSESIQYELAGSSVTNANISTLAVAFTSLASPAALPGTFTPVRISLIDQTTNTVKAVAESKGGAFALVFSDLAGLTLSVQPTVGLSVSGQLTVTAAAGFFTGYAVGASETLIATVDYCFDLEKNSAIPEVEVGMDSEMLKAKTRKLKTIWTPEAEMDFRAYHDIDLEEELTGIMTNLMAQNVNREGINDLLRIAGLRFEFDYATSGTGVAGGSSGNFKDRNIALVHAVNDVAAQIHRFTNRGPANFIVTGPEIAARFANVNTWKGAGNIAPSDAAVYAAGELEGRYKVFVMTSFPRGKILIGRKPQSQLEAAYIHAPYVPILMTDAILDPTDFTPRKAMLSRYAKHLVEDGQYYYATLNIRNLFSAGGAGGSIFGGSL